MFNFFSDFRIRVVNVDDFKYTELNGHEAPILGLSLDPQEVFVVKLITNFFISIIICIIFSKKKRN